MLASKIERAPVPPPDPGRDRLRRARRFWSVSVVEQIAKLVAVLTLGVAVLYVVGFTLWTTWISFTDSTLLPDYAFDRDMAIYTVVIAAVWQASGFAMALFLAGLRSLDPDLYKAAQIDGASPARMYLRIMVPAMWPIVIAVLVILLQFAIKTYELVRALTAGGPGIATTLPTTVVYDYMFQRGLMGAGSAAAVMLLLSLLVIVVPYAIYQRLSGRRMNRSNA